MKGDQGFSYLRSPASICGQKAVLTSSRDDQVLTAEGAGFGVGEAGRGEERAVLGEGAVAAGVAEEHGQRDRGGVRRAAAVVGEERLDDQEDAAGWERGATAAQDRRSCIIVPVVQHVAQE